MSEISARAQPNSLVDLAREERRLGRMEDAEATLRTCIERYPRFPPAVAALADLLASLGRTEDAANLWYSAIRTFPESVQKWWFFGLAATLQRLDRIEEEEAVLRDAVRQFPGSPEILARQADLATRREDWSCALELWEKCVEFRNCQKRT